jgi:hypothetical protein
LAYPALTRHWRMGTVLRRVSTLCLSGPALPKSGRFLKTPLLLFLTMNLAKQRMLLNA